MWKHIFKHRFTEMYPLMDLLRELRIKAISYLEDCTRNSGNNLILLRDPNYTYMKFEEGFKKATEKEITGMFFNEKDEFILVDEDGDDIIVSQVDTDSLIDIATKLYESKTLQSNG